MESSLLVCATTICGVTPGCMRRAPSAKLRRALPFIEPMNLRLRMMTACEKCTSKVVSVFCAETGFCKCSRRGCYRASESGTFCAECKAIQRDRQRKAYHSKKTRNEVTLLDTCAPSYASSGFACTHCSAIIPLSERRISPRGRAQWVQKCATCLARNREADARRRGKKASKQAYIDTGTSNVGRLL